MKIKIRIKEMLQKHHVIKLHTMTVSMQRKFKHRKTISMKQTSTISLPTFNQYNHL